MFEPFMILLNYMPSINHNLELWFLIFTRFLTFIISAPVLNRKEIPGMVKIAFAIVLAVIMVETIPFKTPGDRGEAPFYFLIFLNAVIGYLLGFIANLIFIVIASAGDMANNQMGLSSATLLDPTQKSQTSLAGMTFGLLAIVIFMNIDGPYWLFLALHRTFEIFPVFADGYDITGEISIEYLIMLAGNTITVAFIMVAPIIVVTLAQDLLLGIVSKTAPQINVFQLSFIFKPVIGIAVLLVTMPILLNLINWHFINHSRLF